MRCPRPARRARLLTLAVVGAALLAACVPVTPPPPPTPAYQTQYCAGGTPVNAGQYQSQHDGLRTVNTDFGAGDGGTPVALPDGRTLWMFADTWTGYILNNAMADPYHLVRNAFVVQSGGCLTPVMGGSHGARTDVIPAPPGQFSWPMGAFVDGPTLYVFVEHYVPGGGLCGCVALDVQIAKFALPSLQYLGTSASPAQGLLPEFGSSVFSDQAFHYIVGRSDPSGTHRDYHYLARVPLGADPVTTAWQYWNGGSAPSDADNWSPTGMSVACAAGAPGAAGTGGACPMQFEMPGSATLGPAGPNASLWVIPRTDGSFVASAKPHDVNSSVIDTWRSSTKPYGPWTGPTWAQNTSPPPGGFTYSGRVFQLPGASPTASYNTNGPDNDHHTDVYKILFLGPNFPYA